MDYIKTRGGDDRVCSPTTSFFHTNSSNHRGGDDRVCSPTTSFFHQHHSSNEIKGENEIEKQILSARVCL